MEINTSFTQPSIPLSPDKAQAQSVHTEAGTPTALPSQTLTVMPETNIAELLKLFGFKPSAENVELLETLIDKGFPVSKENLQSLNRSVKLSGLPPERAVFMLQNDIKPNTQNAEQLKGYVNREIRMLEQLSGLLEQIDALPDEAQKNNLLRRLAGTEVGARTSEASSIAPANRAVAGDTPEIAIAARLAGGSAEEIVKTSPELSPLPAEAAKLAEPAKAALMNIVSSILSDPEQAPAKIAAEFNNLTKDLSPELKKAVLDAAVKELIQAGKPELASELQKAVGGEAVRLRGGDNTRPEAALARENNELKSLIESKLLLDPKKADIKDIDELLTEIKRGADAVKAEALKGSERESPVFKAADNLSRNIDFLNEIKSCVYVQLPVVIDGQKTEAELYVFSDKKTKNKKASSALIALDLAALKRFECYLTKNENTVGCQFRLELPEAEDLIRENITRLNSLLADKGLRLEAISYMRLSEPFVLTDDEPGAAEKKHGYETSVNLRA